MTAPTAASEAAELGGADQGPRPLMAREFLVLTGFIASLLDDLSSAPPDWSTADTRFETLQHLAMAREQLVRGWATEAGAYNGLITAWPNLRTGASTVAAEAAGPAQQTLV